MNVPKHVVLIILDGWGLAPEGPGNAITQAKTPNFDRLWAAHLHTQLVASGEAVGLPRKEDGNSETGHLNLGAGQIVFQELPRIDRAIADGTAVETERKTSTGKKLQAWMIPGILYRVPNENIFDQVNTIKKMAQKRALVAATLVAVNASEFFTQDLEDLDVSDFIEAEYRTVEPEQKKPENTKPEQPTEPPKKKTEQTKCPVCHATGNAHAPWCVEDNTGNRIDNRKQAEQGEPEFLVWCETCQSIVEGEHLEGCPEAKPPTERPLSAETIRETCRKKAWGQTTERTTKAPASNAQIGAVAGLMSNALKTGKDDNLDEKRHAVLAYLYGIDSTNDLSKAEASAVISWLKDPDSQGWDLHSASREEAAKCYIARMEELGQQSMEVETE